MDNMQEGSDQEDINHSDHPTYIFKVTVEYIGKWYESYLPEDHYLIFADSNIALTIYKNDRFVWSTKNGSFLWGDGYKKDYWALNVPSLLRIKSYSDRILKNNSYKKDNIVT